MIARVVENRDGEIAHGAMSCDGIECQGESWVTCEHVIDIKEDDLGNIRADVEHASGDRFTLRANYAQRIEIYH